jgi:1,4-alpha-glucan branching enzyme
MICAGPDLRYGTTDEHPLTESDLSALRGSFGSLELRVAQMTVITILRSAGADPVVVVSNFTPVPRENYVVPMPLVGKWVERINTDAGWYGGSNTGNQGAVTASAVEGRHMPAEATLYLPPLSTLILKHEAD